MSSPTFTDDVPRISVGQVAALVPRDEKATSLDLTIEFDGQQHIHLVTLTSTPLPRRGGRRWWWRCPQCGRRSWYLYPTYGLACWRCAGLRHTSQYRRPGAR